MFSLANKAQALIGRVPPDDRAIFYPVKENLHQSEKERREKYS